ncbi:WxL domain-containing protein (plasmid) [Pontibacillus sp. ALD_SL1]|uniref:WxL domain-containing protein n=1 Tax=Pontibacillus sp. ALD_SL1 TaxID=2777185 RepID=UPI001A95E051|nr:WxL domain-containing protein [Pontibacillus sp. ALD_SL1]QST02511.1 WxL domain-containing protein [Pontibacillus sp. ALD_SL1]
MKRWLQIGLFLIGIGWMSGEAVALSGNGTSGDPYVITTCTELQSIPSLDTDTGTVYIEGYFELGNDIDCSDTVNWNGGKGFDPIGNYSTDRFNGSFNGMGYKIKNLSINRPTEDYVGLFGVSVFAYIYNVGLEDVDITGQDNVGGLVGSIEGTNPDLYDQLFTTGVINGRDRVGGIAGITYARNMSHMYSRAAVTGSSWIGGIFGYVITDDDWYDSYATGIVSGSSEIGGAVGFEHASTLDDCHCYWDTEASGTTLSDMGTGKTTSEMKQESTYTGWDFTNTWAIDPLINDGYPYLQSVPPSPTIVTDGLVGYWHYKEGVDEAGGVWENIAPATKGQYDGVINGGALSTDGVSFGTGDTFLLEDGNRIPEGSGFTVFYSVYQSIEDTFHSFYNWDSNALHLLHTGEFRYYNYIYNTTSGSYEADVTVVQINWDNQPLQIGVTHDYGTKTKRLYVNGTLVITDTYSFNDKSKNMAYEQELIYGYKGLVKQVKFYNRILSPDEVAHNYTISPDEVGLNGSTSTAPGTTPPAEVTGLSEIHNDRSVTLSWNNPADSDLDSVNIYRDGVLVGNSSSEIYTDAGLTASTLYSYTIKTLDTSGNESSGVSLNVTTDPPSPHIANRPIETFESGNLFSNMSGGTGFSRGTTSAYNGSYGLRSIVAKSYKYALSSDYITNSNFRMGVWTKINTDADTAGLNGITFGVQDLSPVSQTGYQIVIDERNGGKIHFRKDYDFTTSQEFSVPISVDTWYYVEGIWNGTTIEGTVYDEGLNPIWSNTFTDNTYTDGYFGVASYSSASFDDVAAESDGALSITAPAFVSFPSVTLGEGTNGVTANLPALTVGDERLGGGGWELSVSATPFTESGGAGYTFPTGSLSLKGPDGITETKGPGGAIPSLPGGAFLIDDGGTHTLVTALDGEGVGTFTVSFPSDALTLTIPSSVPLVDGANYPSSPTPYRSTIQWVLSAGP